MRKLLLLLSISCCGIAFAQSPTPTVSITPANPSICTGGCITLNASVVGTVATTSYSVSPTPYVPFSFTGPNPVLVNIDDTWSGVINIPFCFSFYGNTYTQCVIGSNAVISFNLTNATNYNTWPISAAIPSSTPADLLNCIMGPWHDIDPSVTTYSNPQITWGVYGTAPGRAFVVSYNTVSMFSCNTMIATSQIVLYETTNIIDIYIKDKPLCSTWNSGAAIEGIQNSTGTLALAAPGRNYPAQWTATNDGMRFTPTGTPQYSFSWIASPNTVISTALSVTVCPNGAATYTAQAINNSCTIDTVSSSVTVTTGNLFTTISIAPVCSSNTSNVTANPSGGTAPYYYQWSGGQTTQTATGLVQGTYTLLVTDAGGCAGQKTINVPAASLIDSVFITTPICGNNNGSAATSISNGTPPYTYSWSNGSTTSAVTGFAGQPSDTLVVTITDFLGCVVKDTAIIQCVTGIANYDLLNQFSITPNPTSGIFHVQMSKVEDLQIEIYNVYGECIYRHTALAANRQIDLSEAPNGIYFLRVSVPSGQLKTSEGMAVKKLVISK